MERWEEQRGTMVNTHARFMREVADEFEQKLEEDKVLKGSMANEKFEKEKEFAEEESQLEDDVDTEIENIRDRYDAQLSSERELTLRFKVQMVAQGKRKRSRLYLFGCFFFSLFFLL
jgi:hypothetical protein